MKLIADVEPIDRARAARLVLAWLRGDRAAMEYVLNEANAEPSGVASLIFSVTDYAATMTEVAVPTSAEAQLEQAILDLLSPDSSS